MHLLLLGFFMLASWGCVLPKSRDTSPSAAGTSRPSPNAPSTAGTTTTTPLPKTAAKTEPKTEPKKTTEPPPKTEPKPEQKTAPKDPQASGGKPITNFNERLKSSPTQALAMLDDQDFANTVRKDAFQQLFSGKNPLFQNTQSYKDLVGKLLEFVTPSADEIGFIDGLTPIAWSVLKTDDAWFMNKLLKNVEGYHYKSSALVNEKSENGRTALQQLLPTIGNFNPTIKAKKRAMAKRLISAGADLRPPLTGADNSQIEFNDGRIMNPLTIAVFYDDLDMLEHIITTAKAKAENKVFSDNVKDLINSPSTNPKETALQAVARALLPSLPLETNRLKMMKLLIDNGADIMGEKTLTSYAEEKIPLLARAAMARDFELVKYVLAKAAEANSEYDILRERSIITKKTGDTALQYAAMNLPSSNTRTVQDDIIELLIKKGAPTTGEENWIEHFSHERISLLALAAITTNNWVINNILESTASHLAINEVSGKEKLNPLEYYFSKVKIEEFTFSETIANKLIKGGARIRNGFFDTPRLNNQDVYERLLPKF
jgi:hypothetical protein